MSSKTPKTWSELEQEIEHTFSLFHGSRGYILESPFVNTRAAEKRRAGRAPQTLEQRTVTLRWTYHDLRRDVTHAQARQVVLTVQREETALANLELLVKSLEWIRLAHVRDIERPVVKLLRQMYPEAHQQQRQQTQPPPQQERVQSSGPYAVLHIVNDAPLEVAEAAYRALAKQMHPEVGGTHKTFSMAGMKALNDAIEQIRTQHGIRKNTG